MTLRLLCISNPGAYQGATTDIPLSYERLAAHEGVELFHAETYAMMDDPESIAAVRLDRGFKAEQFAALDERPTRRFASDAFDVAFCRTLKPFPEGYLTALQRKTPWLPFVNDPHGIERQLQPGFVLDAAGPWMPATVVPADALELGRFLEAHGTVVAKRANSCGGRGVFRIDTADGLVTDNVRAGEARFDSVDGLYGHLTDRGTLPILVMRYLPRVTEGEKRVVVVDGEIYGAYLRRSPDGHWVQNLSMGARPEPTSVGDFERKLVHDTSDAYRQEGIHILGYDLLPDRGETWKVSEINAGNIGGLFRLETMGAGPVTDRFVRWLRERFTRRGLS